LTFNKGKKVSATDVGGLAGTHHVKISLEKEIYEMLNLIIDEPQKTGDSDS